MKRNQPAPVPAHPAAVGILQSSAQLPAGLSAESIGMVQCLNAPTAAIVNAQPIVNAPCISQNNAPVIMGNGNVMNLGCDPAIIGRLLDTISQLQRQNGLLLDKIISQQETICNMRLQMAGLNA